MLLFVTISLSMSISFVFMFQRHSLSVYVFTRYSCFLMFLKSTRLYLIQWISIKSSDARIYVNVSNTIRVGVGVEFMINKSEEGKKNNICFYQLVYTPKYQTHHNFFIHFPLSLWDEQKNCKMRVDKYENCFDSQSLHFYKWVSIC